MEIALRDSVQTERRAGPILQTLLLNSDSDSTRMISRLALTMTLLSFRDGDSFVLHIWWEMATAKRTQCVAGSTTHAEC